MVLFGRYAYAYELGRGATGRVLAARDQAEGGALRALKVVPEAEAGRLLWEVSRLGRVDHPRVARVREVLRIEEHVPAPFALARGSLVLVEDAAPGQALSEVIKRPARDSEELAGFALDVAMGVGEALAAVHAAGLVHGDVKPDNVLWDDAAGATLVDLGFARPPSTAAAPWGTPRYMAPESLSGLCTAAADVYALGALLFDWLLGEQAESFGSGAGGRFVLRDVRALAGRCPEALARVIGEMLHPDPLRRPGDGRAVFSRLVGAARALGRPVDPEALRYAATFTEAPAQRAQRARTLPFVGRNELILQLVTALGQPGVVWLEGARGAGASRAVREGIRCLQVQRASAGRRVPTWIRCLSALEELRDTDAVLWLERPQVAHVQEASRAVQALALRGLALTVVLEGAPSEARLPAWPAIAVGSLSAPDFDALFARLVEPQRPREGAATLVRAASQGLAGRLCELVARGFAEGRDPSDPLSYGGPGVAWGEDDAWSQHARNMALWLAWCAEAPHTTAAPENLPGVDAPELALDELRARAALEERDGHLRLSPSLARRLRRNSMASGRAFARALVQAGVSVGRLPGLLRLAYGDGAGAREALLGEARVLREQGSVDEAAALLAEALEHLDDLGLRILLADVERARARYREALAMLAGCEAPEARFLRAEIARLAGDAGAAQAALRGLSDAAWGARATALRARLCFDAADYAGARAAAAESVASSDGAAQVRGLEVEVLLGLAEGRADPRSTSALVGKAQALGSGRALARALALRAQAWLARHERARALVDLREAVQRSRAAGEIHEAATYALNLGLVQLDEGALGEALESLRDAAYTLARIDRSADLVRVLFNLAHAALLVGDESRAELALGEASQRLREANDPAASALIAVARAELLLRRGAVSAGGGLLEGALADLPPAFASLRVVVAARAGSAQLLAGQTQRAEQLWEEARKPAYGEALPLDLRVLQIRLALARGQAPEACALASSAVHDAGETAPFADRVGVLLAAIEAARAASREFEAQAWTALCRALLERAMQGLSPALRASMRAVPAYARVLSATPESAPPPSEAGAARWRTLVRGTRRLFAEARPSRVAQRVADLALDLVHAERALVVVEGEGGELAVQGRAELRPPDAAALPFSRSVVQRVWLEGAAVLSVEAAADARFDSAQSVHSMSVRSVLAMPLEGLRGRAVLYLDDRLRAAAFSAEDQALLMDLAELCRQALRTSQSLVQEQRRARQAERRTEQLAEKLESLLSDAQPPAPAPFVGVSPVMHELAERARRVASSDVPVLIAGPSGTGKELLARFVHAQSARSAGGFVAENCAALPDTLLESALFGHVRGAFSGAERARRGLFELADGGTLLLDEVAEMSPAMQSKLLRVLQEGEFRAVGSERLRRVNVRVLAASHRDLAALVRTGQFREDLYYRLAVVTLEVPPLAERREDIPLLVRHFVALHRGKHQRVSVSAQAMRHLEARDYPGNVRQLENLVRRALALCEGQIELEHVADESGAVLAGPRPGGGAEASRDELDLHAQTAHLTRRLVRTAMARTGGNVTQAAQLLGISRFGLQKILARLAEEPARYRK